MAFRAVTLKFLDDNLYYCFLRKTVIHKSYFYTYECVKIVFFPFPIPHSETFEIRNHHKQLPILVCYSGARESVGESARPFALFSHGSYSEQMTRCSECVCSLLNGPLYKLAKCQVTKTKMLSSLCKTSTCRDHSHLVCCGCSNELQKK